MIKKFVWPHKNIIQKELHQVCLAEIKFNYYYEEVKKYSWVVLNVKIAVTFIKKRHKLTAIETNYLNFYLKYYVCCYYICIYISSVFNLKAL